MFGDALATWFIVLGIVLVLAVAALVFLISWRITARKQHRAKSDTTLKK